MEFHQTEGERKGSVLTQCCMNCIAILQAQPDDPECPICLGKNENVFEALLDIYLFIQNKTGALDTFSRFAKVCLKKKNMTLLLYAFDRYLLECSIVMQAGLSAQLVRALLY